MKRLILAVILSFLVVFPAYADDVKQIPERPKVDESFYEYNIIFYNKLKSCYFLIYSSEPCTVGNSVRKNGQSTTFAWFPNSSDKWELYTSWATTDSQYGYGACYYICSNYDLKKADGSIVVPQASDSAFKEHAKSNFDAYSDYWDASGEDGGNAGIISGLRELLNAILSLPTKIVNGILTTLKTLFIPTDGFVEEKVNQLVEKFKAAFGITAFDMSLVFGGSKAVADIDVSIYGSTATIVDTSFLSEALDFFRPVIRGFIVLMLFFYNLNQFMGFIGQAPLSLGRMVDISNGSRSGKEDKAE